jgi:hypothetical protein
MPIQSNIAIQTVGTVAWDGTVGASADIRKFVRFAWSFQIVTTLVADLVMGFEAAPVSAIDNCLPGTFVNVDAIASCTGVAVAGQATVTIPAGTVAGTICSGTIPCRSGAFIRLEAVSGDATALRAVLLRQGPQM